MRLPNRFYKSQVAILAAGVSLSGCSVAPDSEDSVTPADNSVLAAPDATDEATSAAGTDAPADDAPAMPVGAPAPVASET